MGSRNEAAIKVDVVLPVYNEEKELANSVTKLSAFLRKSCPYNWRIVIADNASIDATQKIGSNLAARHSEVHYLRLALKGRGRALREAWLNSNADIVSYMDVDLSTDLSALIPTLEKLVTGEADIVIGSRYLKDSVVERGLKREVLSRGYIGLIKLFFQCSFTDSQCGFKAVSRRAAQTLVPLIENQGWFFDAELLLLAEHYGFRIAEQPITWIDDLDSRVNIVQTVSEHFAGLMRLRLAFSTGFMPQPEATTYANAMVPA